MPEGSSRTADREGALQSSTPAIPNMGCALPVHKEGLQSGVVRAVHGPHKMRVDQERESDNSRNCERDDRTQAAYGPQGSPHHHHAAAGQGA
jgi:hypothetical protein